MDLEIARDVVDHLPHPVFVKDASLRYVLVNKAFCQLAGQSADHILGHTAEALFASKESARYAETDRAALRSGDRLVSKLERFTDRSGQLHFLTTTRVAMPATGGANSYVLGIVHDLTELHTRQAKLEATKAALEERVEEGRAALKATQAELLRRERLAALGQLSAGIAHQIRNPLGAISNAAAILKRQLNPEDGSDGDRALGIIQEEVAQANGIITGLVNYARVGPPSLKNLALEEIVDATTALRGPPDNVDLAYDVDPSVHVEGDAEQLINALSQVLVNAYEAMPSGGEIRIVTRTAPGDANLQELVVSDTGPGIDPSELELVFEPLMSHKPSGIGLGLSIARVLVENQGGTLSAGSSELGGAALTLRLRKPSETA